MASIKLCDRCGQRIYYPKTGWIRSNIYYGDVIISYPQRPEENNYDLCTDCMKSFESWMEAAKDTPD